MVGRNLGGQRTFRRPATKALQPTPPAGGTEGWSLRPCRGDTLDEEAPSVARGVRRSLRRRSMSTRASSSSCWPSRVGGVDEGVAAEWRAAAAARRALRLDDTEPVVAALEVLVAEERPPEPRRCRAVMTKLATSSSQRWAGDSG